ncbi:glycoside hydrolase family 105 protein [Litorimonas sp. RW-G-Af-16]
MVKTRHTFATSLLLSACMGFGALGLTACGSASETTTSQSAEKRSIFSEASIIDVTNGVADWQMARMERPEWEPYVPSFQHRTIEKRGWIQGTYFKGLVDWAAQTDNERYFTFLKNFAENEDYQPEARIYHADDHVVGQYYFALYEKYKDPAMIAPIQEVFDKILENPSTVSLDFGPKSKEEGYSHECLKRWCWADALFMAPPVWTKLSKITGDQKYLDFSDKETWITTDYLFDEEAGLFLRDSRFFERREENGKKIYWSRGNGWVFAGLTDIIDDLPADYPSRQRYIDLYKTMAASLIEKQAENGYWPVSLDAGELYPVKESSGTAFFVAGLAWGLANGTLDEATYMEPTRKGWAALNDAVADDGMIGWVQQVGYAPDKVSANETQFYGAGAFLLAGAAMLELAEQGKLEE